MRRMLTSLILGFVLTSIAGAQDNNQPPDGFSAIFNGKDLTGWYGLSNYDRAKLAKMSDDQRAKLVADGREEARANWTVEDGELVNDGHGQFLTTEKLYGDIELFVDYKTVAKADSGIYLRGMPQIQIWDYTKDGGKWNLGADKGSGGLWNNSPGAAGKDPAVLADKPFGEWNRFRILQVGARTSVWLNGKHIVDHATMENLNQRQLPLFRTGPIQLQTHGGEIRWRNIFVRKIGSEEANKILADASSDGFETVFNGKNLDGWAGPLDNYKIVDGTLMCKQGKGGTIYTNKIYDDFVVRLEFKLPPGGNNGLAIRYPGEGDTAYVGMTELQVLDNTAPKYAKLDKRQYHGSAYGMSPAYRGYLRPIGEWNFQEVTVKGSTIRVELNGSIILNADLSKIDEFMSNTPHPGKDRTRGHFGFAGHSDPVQFRDVKIKTLAP